eukprot:gene6819-7035_t
MLLQQDLADKSAQETQLRRQLAAVTWDKNNLQQLAKQHEGSMRKLQGQVERYEPEQLKRLEQGSIADVSDVRQLAMLAADVDSGNNTTPQGRASTLVLQQLRASLADTLQPSQRLWKLTGSVLLTNQNSACCAINSIVQCLLVMATGAQLMQVPPAGAGPVVKAVQHLLQRASQLPSEGSQWQQAETQAARKKKKKKKKKKNGARSSNKDSSSPARGRLVQRKLPSMAVKAALVEAAPGLFNHVDLMCSADEVLDTIRGDVHQGAWALGPMGQPGEQSSLATQVATVQGQLLSMHVSFKLSVERMVQEGVITAAVAGKVLKDSMIEECSSGRQDLNPAAVSLVRGPSDLVLQVTRQQGSISFDCLKSVSISTPRGLGRTWQEAAATLTASGASKYLPTLLVYGSLAS